MRLGIARALLLASGLLAACAGRVADTPPATVDPAALSVGFGPTPVRFLTRTEYDNTIRDLLGDDAAPARQFPVEPTARGAFDNDIAGQHMAPLHVEAHLAAAQRLAHTGAQRWLALGGCDRARTGEDACAQLFVARMGLRAYRRPIDAAETAALMSAFAAGGKEGDFALGLEAVLQRLLQSPNFLYRLETGSTHKVRALTPWEIASRLSYFLWRTMPDDALFRAAAEGQLSTPVQVRARAAAMLNDPRAKDMVVDFHRQWLRLTETKNLEKTAKVFPEFDKGLRASMTGELRAFVEGVIWDGPGDFGSLISAPISFVDQRLANLYGVPPPPGEGFIKVKLDPEKRAGLLTQAWVLAEHATNIRSSPIARGLLVREQILCDPLSDPPPGSAAKLPKESKVTTTRARFAVHAEDPFCASCHEDIDPIGFLFEHYDALGRWRDKEGDHPVDASGEVLGAEIAGSLNGAPALAQALAHSPKASACFVERWHRYAFGRAMTVADRPALQAAQRRFLASGGDIKNLIVDLCASDPFLHHVDP